MAGNNPIQVADRLFGAVELLSGEGALGLAEIAQRLALNKSTAHRVLQSLQYLGYVRQEPDGRYTMSYKLVGLASQIISQSDTVAIVHPFLRSLMERTGETVHFVRREGTRCVYIDKVESNRNTVQMVSRVGSSIAMYCSGVGKAIAADLPDEEIRLLWESSEVSPITAKTITNFDKFMEVIGAIRKQGYALDDEENELGVRCVAASLPAVPMGGQYAMSISAPIGRMEDDRIRELAADLMAVKAEIKAIFS